MNHFQHVTGVFVPTTIIFPFRKSVYPQYMAKASGRQIQVWPTYYQQIISIGIFPLKRPRQNLVENRFFYPLYIGPPVSRGTRGDSYLQILLPPAWEFPPTWFPKNPLFPPNFNTLKLVDIFQNLTPNSHGCPHYDQAH